MVPLGSASITFRTQLSLPTEGTGSGGPKKQRASETQNGPSPDTAQSLSTLHGCAGFLAQCLVAAAPWVQTAGPPAACAVSVATLPLHPLTSKIEVGPSGFWLGATRLLPPPPM